MRERKVAWCSRFQPVEVQALLAEILLVEIRFVEIRFVEFMDMRKRLILGHFEPAGPPSYTSAALHDLAPVWRNLATRVSRL